MKVYIILDEQYRWDGDREEVSTIIDSVHATKENAVAKAKALQATVLEKNNGAHGDTEYWCPPNNRMFCACVTWENEFNDEINDVIHVEEWEVED